MCQEEKSRERRGTERGDSRSSRVVAEEKMVSRKKMDGKWKENCCKEEESDESGRTECCGKRG